MASFNVQVVLNDQEHMFPVKPRTVLAFERKFGMGLAKAFSTDQRMEHIYFLGWESMRSSGHVVKPFESWLDEVDEVQLIPKDESVAT
jgi:hypothetical protein